MTEFPHHIVIIDPQHEKLAASHLTGRGISCYLPLEPAYRTRGARRRPMKIQVPIFRGYLFVRVDQHYAITAVDTVYGVRHVMARDSIPIILCARAMSAVREIERRQQSPGAPFLQGDLVRVLTGLMEDETLSVSACEDDDVILLVEMMGRKVKMRRDVFDVELVTRTSPKLWHRGGLPARVM